VVPDNYLDTLIGWPGDNGDSSGNRHLPSDFHIPDTDIPQDNHATSVSSVASVSSVV